ncbi:MAG: hypothetical protein HYW48_09150 [Deltaproteobacteria bacterium]|nr:hypothetical protein [Deltaproteobacteria bacterium]
MDPLHLIWITAILTALWGLSLKAQVGIPRSAAIAACRFLWILPLLLAFHPENEQLSLPKTIVSTPVSVLIDDSLSMKHMSEDIEGFLEDLRSFCLKSGCELRTSKLSQEDMRTQLGYSPMRRTLEKWLPGLENQPWLLFTDGGDSRPSLSWPLSLQNLGAGEGKLSRGFIVGVEHEAEDNAWIEESRVTPFAFAETPLSSSLLLVRTRDALDPEHLQVQLTEGDQILASQNASFQAGQDRVWVDLSVPPLPRGNHLLKFKVLPSPDESVLWDNEVFESVEVVSNTLGILHLLGSPSWDGRFLRRYLKTEPKYDLVSFFILRDPWDRQDVNEREISLIPFPVSRLFNEELINFRVVVLQNFNLLQFLLPEYQKSLVDFVKNGGGLLFVGGKRALLTQDLQGTPLKELLPFDLQNSNPTVTPPGLWDDMDWPVDKKGPWFDRDLRFKIEVANPSPEKRALATVLNEWALLSHDLGNFQDGKGLHHMENIVFREEQATPLLNAIAPDGKRIPLAVASYPGKGRALWIFTDSLWRMAMGSKEALPRSTYNQFMESAFTWLLRHDFRKSLAITKFEIESKDETVSTWTASLYGPTVRYFQATEDWKLSVCDTPVDIQDVIIDNPSPNRVNILGHLQGSSQNLRTCRFEVSGVHPAFGSVKETLSVQIPGALKDSVVGGSSAKLKQLSKLTGAPLSFFNGDRERTKNNVREWLANYASLQGLVLPDRYVQLKSYYWVMHTWWFFLLLLFLPLEVIVRRWHILGAKD